ALAEEHPERPERTADRQRRQLRGDRVLRDPRPVERGRRCEREDEADDEGDLVAHGTRLAAWSSSLPTSSGSSRTRFGRSSTSGCCPSPSRTTSTTSSTSS